MIVPDTAGRGDSANDDAGRAVADPGRDPGDVAHPGLAGWFCCQSALSQRVDWVGRDAELGRVGAVRWGAGRTVAERGRSIIPS